MHFAKESMIDAGAKFEWNDESGMNDAEYTKDGVVYKMWLEGSDFSGRREDEVVSDHQTTRICTFRLGLERFSSPPLINQTFRTYKNISYFIL